MRSDKAAFRRFLPLVLTGLVAILAEATAAAPLDGYWAAEESDCSRRQFVWHFTGGRVALLIDNRPVTEYLPATFAGGSSQERLRFANASGRSVEFTITIRSEREILIADAKIDGTALRMTHFGPWIRCDGGR